VLGGVGPCFYCTTHVSPSTHFTLSSRFILSRRTSSRPVDLPYRTHVVREVCNAGCQPPSLDIAHLTRRAESFCPCGSFATEFGT